MGRPRTSDPAITLSISMPGSWRTPLHTAAMREGLSVSEWVRNHIGEALGIETPEPDAVQATLFPSAAPPEGST